MTAAYLRPQGQTRTTSNYTLAVETPGKGAVLVTLHYALQEQGLLRTSSISDNGRVGVSWRSATDEDAEAVSRALIAALVDAGHAYAAPHCWTGYGIHTREVPL